MDRFFLEGPPRRRTFAGRQETGTDQGCAADGTAVGARLRLAALVIGLPGEPGRWRERGLMEQVARPVEFRCLGVGVEAVAAQDMPPRFGHVLQGGIWGQTLMALVPCNNYSFG